MLKDEDPFLGNRLLQHSVLFSHGLHGFAIITHDPWDMNVGTCWDEVGTEQKGFFTGSNSWQLHSRCVSVTQKEIKAFHR